MSKKLENYTFCNSIAMPEDKNKEVQNVSQNNNVIYSHAINFEGNGNKNNNSNSSNSNNEIIG